jgi:hypothetical protein
VGEVERARALPTSDSRDEAIDRVTSEIHAFRAEAGGRSEVAHRDFDELRREVREDLDAMRRAIARGFVAIAVVLLVGFLAVAALLAVRA